MWAYVITRLLLMIPTLFGILLITFIIIQFVPGGPVEQMVSQLQGRGAVYAVDDPTHRDLYFAQSTDDEFGSLARLSAADAAALFAERGGDPDRSGKQGPLDCLVWRQAREGRIAQPRGEQVGRQRDRRDEVVPYALDTRRGENIEPRRHLPHQRHDALPEKIRIAGQGRER